MEDKQTHSQNGINEDPVAVAQTEERRLDVFNIRLDRLDSTDHRGVDRKPFQRSFDVVLFEPLSMELDEMVGAVESLASALERGKEREARGAHVIGPLGRRFRRTEGGAQGGREDFEDVSVRVLVWCKPPSQSPSLG